MSGRECEEGTEETKKRSKRRRRRRRGCGQLWRCAPAKGALWHCARARCSFVRKAADNRRAKRGAHALTQARGHFGLFVRQSLVARGSRTFFTYLLTVNSEARSRCPRADPRMDTLRAALGAGSRSLRL